MSSIPNHIPDINHPLLSIKNLSVFIENPRIFPVDSVSFDIYPNKTLALIGESGCGKSMTALALMRLLPNNATYHKDSQVLLHGTDLLSLTEHEMQKVRGQDIAMIFQDPMICLNPVLTIGQQLTESLKLHQNLHKLEQYKSAIELLTAVKIPHPEDRFHAYPHELSGGMKQRVMIAIALAGKPKLLIADEPTTALDVTTQAQILQLIKDLQCSHHMALLLITHDLAIASQMANHIAVMYAGEIIEYATNHSFFQRPSHPYSEKLLASLPNHYHDIAYLPTIEGMVPKLDQHFTGCRFANRCYKQTHLCHDQIPNWHELAKTHHAKCHHIDQYIEQIDPTHKDPQLNYVMNSKIRYVTTHHLSVHFSQKKSLFSRKSLVTRAVQDLSVALHQGETLAIVGESGCGKTTLARTLLSLLKPTSGEVYVNQTRLGHLTYPELKNLQSFIQIIFQDPFSSMNPKHRIQTILEEPIKIHAPQLSELERQLLIEKLLLQVSMPQDCLNRFPHEFSGGQRQRISIARALSVKPKVVVCDEPTSALDVSVQAQVLNLLKTIQLQNQISYLFITHNIAVVNFIAHRVAVMHQGQIVEIGRKEEVLSNPQHPYTRLLINTAPKLDIPQAWTKRADEVFV